MLLLHLSVMIMKKQHKEIIKLVVMLLIVVGVGVTSTYSIDMFIPEYTDEIKSYEQNREYKLNLNYSSRELAVYSSFSVVNTKELEQIKDKNKIYDTDMFNALNEFSKINYNGDLKKNINRFARLDNVIVGQEINIEKNCINILYTENGENIFCFGVYDRRGPYKKIPDKTEFLNKEQVIERVTNIFDNSGFTRLHDLKFDYILFDSYNKLCELSDNEKNIIIYYDIYYDRIWGFVYGYDVNKVTSMDEIK